MDAPDQINWTKGHGAVHCACAAQDAPQALLLLARAKLAARIADSALGGAVRKGYGNAFHAGMPANIGRGMPARGYRASCPRAGGKPLFGIWRPSGRYAAGWEYFHCSGMPVRESCSESNAAPSAVGSDHVGGGAYNIWTGAMFTNCPFAAVFPAPDAGKGAWPGLAVTNGGSGSGNGTVAYSVTANSAALARTGAIVVFGGGISRTYTAIQAAASVDAGAERDTLPHLSDNQSIAFTTDGSFFLAMIWDYANRVRESATLGLARDSTPLGYSMTGHLEVHVGYLHD